jgi:hypothetical protein
MCAKRSDILTVSGEMQILTLSYDWQDHASAWSVAVSAQLLLLIAGLLLELLLKRVHRFLREDGHLLVYRCQAIQIELDYLIGSSYDAPDARNDEASDGEFPRASSVETKLTVSTAAPYTMCSTASTVHVSAYRPSSFCFWYASGSGKTRAVSAIGSMFTEVEKRRGTRSGSPFAVKVDT